MSTVHEESEKEKDRAERPRTLLIRHLPSHLPIPEREDLLRFFGAKAVRCMSDFSSMKYSAFAVFDTPDQAAHALQELHQLEVLGSKLTVQYSTKEFLHDAPTKLKLPKPPSESEKKCKVDIEELEPIVPEDIDHLAPYHKIEYPLNPKLMYSYPSPTVEILTNIANALASVPKFYVQVLHLMNKMNLPAPFGPVTQGPPVPSGVHEPAVEELLRISSTEESELESDGDDDKKEKVTPGAKRPSTSRKPVLKRHKLQKIISAPKTGKTLKRHEVFEKPPVDTESVKPKEVSKDNGVDKPIFTDDSTNVKKFITLQELEKHRLSSRRMKRNPLFKDYEPGSPNSTVSVTNLHKDVPEATITFVFGRYINWENESERACYSVNLDRDSKSCTVCFPSEDIAELALQETNGFKLMGEYMVVKFSPKPERETVAVCHVVEAEKLEEEREGNVEEAVSAIQAAFSVPADSTPPHTGRAATPEMTGGATPERATPEIAELEPETNQPVMDVSEEQFTSVTSDDIKDESKRTDSQSKDGEMIEEEPLVDYEDSRYISKSELEKGRITQEKMSHFKVFNNYDPGESSDRLYIKNLNPKQIQESEFVWLFGSFLRDRDRDASEQLDIKIMKEGRMKGQAFVTFPSPSEADKALRASNGYVLHGKPMVIVFGKK